MGPQGPQGPQGPAGNDGVDGQDGTVIAAMFYALMPFDNESSVAVGGDVQFPNTGPSTAGGLISGIGSAFVLGQAGVYRVTYQVPVSEAGQLIITVNGVGVPYTVAGRATSTSNIGTTVLIDAAPGDVITIRNVGISAITITPLAGGTEPSSATLLIEYIGLGNAPV